MTGANVDDLDEIDRKILTILQADGRAALSEIARRLDMGTATIHERVDNLEEDGYIREYRAILDPDLLGVNEVAFIDVHTEPGRSSAVAERMAEAPNLQEIHEVTGDADLLVKIRVRDRAELTDALADLGTYEGVKATETKVALRSVKEEQKLQIPDGE